MDELKSKKIDSIEEKLSQANKEYKAERLCTYGVGIFSAAHFAAASCMYFDERYTNGQVGIMLSGAAIFGLVTYVCSRVTRSSKKRVSKLEGLLNNK